MLLKGLVQSSVQRVENSCSFQVIATLHLAQRRQHSTHDTKAPRGNTICLESAKRRKAAVNPPRGESGDARPLAAAAQRVASPVLAFRHRGPWVVHRWSGLTLRSPRLG